MTRLLLAILFLLPLPFAAGCVEPDDDNPCVGPQCADDDDAVSDDDDEWNATFHLVTPFEWPDGNFFLDGDIVHENDNECFIELDEPGEYAVSISGVDHRFRCVPRNFTVDASDDGSTIELVEEWLEEGACCLQPDGQYGVWDVDSGACWLNFNSLSAVITGNTFYNDNRTETSGSLIEGEIAEDLSWIYYHRVLYDGQEFEGTLPLQDGT